MSPGYLPEGYRSYAVGSAVLVTRPDYFVFVRDALHRFGRFHAYAAALPGAVPLRGRGATWQIEGPGGKWVVRGYRRGGAVARVLGDRYFRLGASRPYAELWASVRARERGIATPEVLAYAVYPAGMFTRADLATRYIEGGRDLAAVLFSDGAEELKQQACEAAGRMVRALGRAGVRHVDLNLKNLMFVPDGAPSMWVLDLDRCEVTKDGSEVSAQPMLARLLRSLEKWERQVGRRVDPALRGALEAGSRA